MGAGRDPQRHRTWHLGRYPSLLRRAGVGSGSRPKPRRKRQHPRCVRLGASVSDPRPTPRNRAGRRPRRPEPVGGQASAQQEAANPDARRVADMESPQGRRLHGRWREVGERRAGGGRARRDRRDGRERRPEPGARGIIGRSRVTCGRARCAAPGLLKPGVRRLTKLSGTKPILNRARALGCSCQDKGAEER
jgi:hypothetical protein